MNPDSLLKHFEQISEAPDAVPRLRRFILDLAVRGKLVEQDSKDEPASELLKRIDAEKEKITKRRNGSKLGSLDIFQANRPFQIPSAWEWVAIRRITADRGQKIPDREFSYIDVSSIDKEGGRIANRQVTTPDAAPSRARKIVKIGDIIYSCVRPYLLNIAVVEEAFDPEPIVSTAFAVLNGFGLVLPHYLWMVLRSPFFVACVEEKMRGQAYPAINDRDFAVLPIPLPPHAEQHRIVAKVEELMVICDELDSAQAKRERGRDRLVAATLHGLSDGASGHELRQNACFYLNDIPRLTTRPEHIHQLRQTILNLAVRGKLFPQDPKDEPADKLLFQIQREKRRVLADSKERNLVLPPIESEAVPFQVPAQWKWVRLGEVIKLWNGFAFKSSDYKQTGVPVVRIGDLQNGHVVLSSAVFVCEDVASSVEDSIWIPENALLIAMSGATTGKVAFNRTGRRLLLNQRVGRVQTFLVQDQYMRFFFETIVRQNLSISYGTAMPNLSVKQINETNFPLPPLAEQHRIVAKVDELMALCDELQARINKTTAARQQLLEAALDEALFG